MIVKVTSKPKKALKWFSEGYNIESNTHIFRCENGKYVSIDDATFNSISSHCLSYLRQFE